MNKKISVILALAALALTGCWKENIPSAGSPRHCVENLAAVAGDEEVALSWSMPEGWNPTGYVVTYNVGVDTSVVVNEMACTVTGLTNGVSYTFSVQARYGDEISGVKKVIAVPLTDRLPVKNLVAESDDKKVTLSWTKPSDKVLSYSLAYGKSSEATLSKTETIAASATEFAVTGLENDVKYTFSLTAVYAKGASDAVTVFGLPALATPFTQSTETPVIGQKVKFRFNAEAYPAATSPKWTFPGANVEGVEAEYVFESAGVKSFSLSVTLDGKTKTWDGSVTVREYTVFSQDFPISSGYNGFKGCCPVFSPDGKTVYMMTFNKLSALIAFDVETGAKKWVAELSGGSYNPIGVNPVSGVIYAGTESKFYAINPDGSKKWEYSSGSNAQSAGPAVSKDGNVVFNINAIGTVAAINAASGSKIWETALGERGAGLLVNGNELVVGTQGHFYFLDASTGAKNGDGLTQTAQASQACGFAVSADGKYLYYGASSAVGIVNLDTKTLGTTLAVGSNLNWQPVVAPNGDVFVGSKDGLAYCMDKELTAIKWSHDSGAGTNAFNFSHPCVTVENYYIITSGNQQNKTWVLGANGAIVSGPWSYGSSGQKQMGGNNLLGGSFYSAMIGATNDNGIFVGKYVGYERAAGWSTYGGDPCGSNCLK